MRAIHANPDHAGGPPVSQGQRLRRGSQRISRRRDIRSFGHLRPISVAPRSLAARASATPATKPSCDATAGGQGSIMRALACRLPFGEIQARPRRPLPAVCSSATIHRRSASPASARRRASSLVESIGAESNDAPASMRAVQPGGGGQKSDCAAAIAALVIGEGANTNRMIMSAESASTMRATGVGRSNAGAGSSKYISLTILR